MKINTANIEGYESMSAEEKLQALESYELELDSDEVNKLKAMLSKANSESANYKRQLEARKKEQDPELATLRDEIATLKKEKTISTYQNAYLKQGYSDELALSTATALADGDTDTVLKNQATFLSEFEQKIKSQQMMNTPKPQVGNGTPKTYTRDEFRKLSPAERYEYAQKFPDEYKTIYGG